MYMLDPYLPFSFLLNKESMKKCYLVPGRILVPSLNIDLEILVFICYLVPDLEILVFTCYLVPVMILAPSLNIDLEILVCRCHNLN